MTLPNFFLIGAAKCGTTSLAAYLQQHPDVFVTEPKEPNFFADPFANGVPKGPAPERILRERIYNLNVLDEQEYVRLFDAAGTARARGEGSVRYLYFPGTAERIAARVPDARLVAVLRDPVSRVFSHYNMNREHQLEPLDLVDALDAEAERIAAGWGWDWHYAAVSRYAPQLRRYFDVFGRERVHVALYDDFVARPVETFQAICRHIGVADDVVPDMSVRSMQPHRPRHRLLDRAINWPHPAKDALKPLLARTGLSGLVRSSLARISAANRTRATSPLDADLRAALAPRFARDVADLSDLLGRPVAWPTA